MPTSPPRRCRMPGCPNVQPCATHAEGWTGDRKRRLPPEWPRLRAFVLDRDGRRCYSPYPDRCIGDATEVDHLVPGDDHSLGNLAAICGPCHRTKSAAEGQAARHPTVAKGPA